MGRLDNLNRRHGSEELLTPGREGRETERAFEDIFPVMPFLQLGPPLEVSPTIPNSTNAGSPTHEPAEGHFIFHIQVKASV